MICLQPYQRYERGQAKYSGFAHRVLRGSVACGRCENCVKTRKRDWSGKLFAEYQTCGSALFVTLTYAKKPKSFVYEDVQGFLKRLRIFLWRRKNRMTVRFFCIGERGDKFGRRHWHLILFFSGNVYGDPDFVSSEMETPGQLWRHWPHGWTDIKPLGERSEALGRMRYCVKYAVKGVGGTTERARCSLKPGLGARYLGALAVETAVKGLVPDGTYSVPGAVWTRGERKGQLQRFKLRGVNRREFIGAWRWAWSKHHPDREMPTSDWLQAFDPDAVSRVFQDGYKRRVDAYVPRIKPGRIVKVDVSRYLEWDFRERWIVTPTWCAQLWVQIGGPHGGSAFLLVDGEQYPVFDRLTETIELPDAVLRDAQAWLEAQRPWGWKWVSDGEKDQQVTADREAQQRAEFDAKLQRHKAECDEARAERHRAAERNFPQSAETLYQSRITAI